MANLSIKNVPEDLAEYLRQRAEENNRSLQGELLTILEESMEGKRTTLNQIVNHIEENDLRTEDDAATTIRNDREQR